MEIDFSKFEHDTGVVFNDKKLLQQAFTHRSYINEHKHETETGHNERLEFLGDAVLELVITNFLYNKYKDKSEGELTSYRAALVNSQTCSRIANKLNFNEFLLLSKGETKDVGRARQYILADTFEAVIGAIYIDQGYDQAKSFILQHTSSLIEDIIAEGSWIDAKSRFQEVAQEREGTTPQYKIIEESGPDHDKNFVTGVFLEEVKIAEGLGRSKQEAEQDAANKALKEKDWE